MLWPEWSGEGVGEVKIPPFGWDDAREAADEASVCSVGGLGELENSPMLVTGTNTVEDIW